MPRLRMPKAKKVKQPSYKLVPFKDEEGEVTEPYRFLQKCVSKWHTHLAKASIACVWKTGWKPDKDGIMVLGKAHKVADLHKEFHDYDLFVILNMQHWEVLNPSQRLALVDHELCHFELDYNKDGSVKKDTKERIIYRYRKHDIEEFKAVVERHGLYKRDIEEFAQSLGVKRTEGPDLPFARERAALRNGESIELTSQARMYKAGTGLEEAFGKLFPEKVLMCLYDAEIHTVGDLEKFIATAPDNGKPALTMLKGISARQAVQIGNALRGFRERKEEPHG